LFPVQGDGIKCPVQENERFAFTINFVIYLDAIDRCIPGFYGFGLLSIYLEKCEK
jgi:hypothetical protein